MPSIIYGGVTYDQVRHAIYCKKCNITIESKHSHDFKVCKCGSAGIDGGIDDGNRILGNLFLLETRAIYRAIIDKKHVYLPKEILEKLFNARMSKN
jgi:hypothetical protein